MLEFSHKSSKEIASFLSHRSIMDRLDMPLDSLVADARKNSAPKKKLKLDNKKAKVVKSSGSRTSVKSRPTRELKQPTAKQVANSLARAAPDSVLSRLGPKQEGTALIISNLNFNISAGDVRELCATVGETGKIFVHPNSGRADVWFLRKEDAIRCAKRYNRVTLDSRPMRVMLKDDVQKSGSSDGRGGSTSSARQPRGGGARDRDQTWGSDRGGGVRETGSGGRDRGTTFSVTMSGMSGSHAAPRKEKKAPVPKQQKKPLLKAKPAKKAAAAKPKSAKEDAPSGADLDADMDSYFASRPAKE